MITELLKRQNKNVQEKSANMAKIEPKKNVEKFFYPNKIFVNKHDLSTIPEKMENIKKPNKNDSKKIFFHQSKIKYLVFFVISFKA